ncbi:MAG: DUF2194 domain-containing protein [Spirochaetales bacterium]|nr:DUF2194 domain-containing protein [Spirochaetales bacterium]
MKRMRKTISGYTIIILFLTLILITGCVSSSTKTDSSSQEVDAKPDLLEEVKVPVKGDNHLLDLHGKKVLALYKSSDNQKESENEIYYHLSKLLEARGMTILYRDIDQGIPDDRLMEDVRAIISWFRGPSMVNPEAYLDFLDRSIISNRKVIIIDNLGAYQYRYDDPAKEEYVDPNRINLTLAKLGLWYRGDWTDNPDLIEIAYKNSEYVEAHEPQDVRQSAFYYKFIPVDRDLRVFLSLHRKDRQDEASPVVTINKNGGFIFTRYIYHNKPDKPPVILINFEKFLDTALFPKVTEEKLLLLTNINNESTKKTYEFIVGILKKSRLNFDILDYTQFDNLLSGDLNKYSTIGLILNSDNKLKSKDFKEYLDNGGSVVSLSGGDFPGLAPSLAASVIPAVPEGFTGYQFKTGFIMGENVALKNSEMKWQRGNLKPADDALILATDASTQNPLLWTAERGKGTVLVWNWNGFLGAGLIGLSLESFLYVRPIGVAATMGMAHMFIDDWPLPMYDIPKEPLPRITDTEYYTKIWWPDIKALLESRNIPFSNYLIFNYNATVNAPFLGSEFYASVSQSPSKIAREIIAEDLELGYHGYNHMSLTLEATSVNIHKWPGIRAMTGSLEEGRRTWSNLLGPETLPFSYVAVNNIISRDGIAALSHVFPGIKIISALHWGVGEETYTDFGPHETIPELYYFPRITYGYQFEPIVRNLLISGAGGPGIISHFIHPDDVYDPYRSGNKTWEELKQEFIEMLDFTQMNYPWIKWVDIREAYQNLVMQETYSYKFRVSGNTLHIKTHPGAMFRVRPNRGLRLKNNKGAEIIYKYTNMPMLILKANSHQVTLEFTK